MSDSSPANKAKVPASLARVGKELQVDVYAPSGVLLLKKGHYVLSGELRDKLLSLGLGDAEEIEAKLERERRERAAARAAEQAAGKTNPFTELEFQTRRAHNLLHHALAAPGFIEGIYDIADSLQRLAQYQPDGLIAATLLMPYKEYGSSHSLHVAALLAVLGRRLGLKERELNSLVCAALTMNLAITELQSMIATSRGLTLQPKQRELLEAHPILSSAILREAGVEDELWHSIVQAHHEKWDGSGTPLGLTKPDIEPLAQLLHMLDLLTAALTHHTPDKPPQPSQAIARLFKGESGQFDPQYVTLVIKELGIYPPGSFVRLASNEIAVVTHRRDRANEPKVAALRKADGPPYAAPIPRDTRGPSYKVLEAVPAAVANVRTGFLSKLWSL